MDQALGALEQWIKKSPHLQQIRQDRQVIRHVMYFHLIVSHKYFHLIISVSVFAFLPAWLRPQCGEDEEGARLLLLSEVKLAGVVLWLGPNPSEAPSQSYAT